MARKGLDGKTADAVRDAFLSLDSKDPQQKQILETLAASKYVAANDADYDKLRQAAVQAGLLK